MRFTMPEQFIPIEGADGWQLSNAPVLSMAAHRASLEIFKAATMDKLTAKSKLLTGYLFYVINDILIRNQMSDAVEIITPRDDNQHGCQVSMLVKKHGRKVFDYLTQNGVVADWREPDVIRIAPVPLYNTFNDVFVFGKILEEALNA